MRQILLIKRCLASYRIRFGHSIKHAVVREVAIREKNELVSYLPGYSHRMVSEILQESLGILIIKKYIKNKTQKVEKRRSAS